MQPCDIWITLAHPKINNKNKLSYINFRIYSDKSHCSILTQNWDIYTSHLTDENVKS